MRTIFVSLPGKGKRNEDSLFLDDERGIYIIADGFPETEGFEPDSAAFAVSALKSMLEKYTLESALENANKEMHAESMRRGKPGMLASTILAAVYGGKRITIAHAGDSRAYGLRGDVLEQLTDDHSSVQRDYSMGYLDMTREELFFGSDLKGPLRYMGKKDIIPQMREIDANDYKRILLATDGLTSYTCEERIESIMRLPPAMAISEIESHHQMRDRRSIQLFVQYNPKVFNLIGEEQTHSILQRKAYDREQCEELSAATERKDLERLGKLLNENIWMRLMVNSRAAEYLGRIDDLTAAVIDHG